MKFQIQNYFDLTEFNQTPHSSICDGIGQVWELLPKIKPYLSAYFKKNPPQILGVVDPSAKIGPEVHIGKGTVVEAGVVIKGPAWIGERCEIRSGAYIREHVIIGDESVIGNSSELKNALLIHQVQVPHFNYVGDSVLGTGAHLGAGVILSNFKLAGNSIVIKEEGESYETGLRKFGAIIGDHAEIGCHAVLNPGSLIGPRSMIYSGVQWRGVLGPDLIVKASVHYTISPKN
jgi:UDP-N-acetylglucosamine diphosphorylase / glucose-1-phosphate thymidylyltransferase / UDP-N-acetylgalactosamine diphosphorylase / glucosamine-1-phosphate N-acetyltransferase / galactosamine-1-phosphate N-acetyltransferase